MNYSDKESLAKLLKEYKDLLDQKIITQEEYDKMRAEALAQLSKSGEETKKEAEKRSKNKKRIALTAVNLSLIFIAISGAIVAITGLLALKLFASSQGVVFGEVELATEDMGYCLVEAFPWTIIPVILMGLFIALAIAVLVKFLIDHNKSKIGLILQLASSTVFFFASIANLLAFGITLSEMQQYPINFWTEVYYSNQFDSAIGISIYGLGLFVFEIFYFVLMIKKPKE